jgi:hypothetical protein
MAAEYVVAVSFSVTAGVAAGITLIGGVITSVATDKITQVYRRSVRQYAKMADRKSVELQQLIEQLPTFQALFEALYPKTSKDKFASFEFAEWLTWAYCGPHTNLREWAIKYAAAGERHVPVLSGLFGHVPQPYLNYVVRVAHEAVVGVPTTIRLRKSDPKSNEGMGSPSNMRQGKAATAEAKKSDARQQELVHN